MENLAREVFYGEKYLDVFKPSDKQRLMEMAEKGNIHAIFCLIKGLSLKERSYDETFVDEDTGEQVVLRRCDVEEGFTFEKEDDEEGKEDEITRLTEMLYEAKERMSEKELCTVLALPIDTDRFCLEIVNRGNEEYADSIRDFGILMDLSKKGNKYAALEAARKCLYGDEEQGIFIDKEGAQRFYDMAGVEMEPFECDDYMDEFDYVLKGDTPDSLTAVKTLIEELTSRYGTPDNEFGLFVPLDVLMMVLVGSPFYYGNVLSMDAEDPNQIKLHVEASSMEPLLYALSLCFPHLDMEASGAHVTKKIEGCPPMKMFSGVHGEDLLK